MGGVLGLDGVMVQEKVYKTSSWSEAPAAREGGLF